MQQLGKLIVIFAFILGVIALCGGIYRAGIQAEAQILLFGQEISTVSVGLGIAFLGIVMIILTFKRAFDLASQLPSQTGSETSGKIIAIVHETGKEASVVSNAEVKLQIIPKPVKSTTDQDGYAILFYPAELEGGKYKIIVGKEGYESPEPKQIVLKNDSQIPLGLQGIQQENPTSQDETHSSGPSSDAKKVFISYAEADIDAARRLVKDLVKAGIRVSFTEGLAPGANREQAIKSGINECDRFIALLSTRAFNEKGDFHSEIAYALSELDKYPPHRIFVIPAHLDQFDHYHHRLSDLMPVKMFPDWENAVGRIIQALDDSGSSFR